MTPEVRVKRRIDTVLKKHRVNLVVMKPVASRFGMVGLDYHCCFYGRCLIIEAKAPGGWLTQRQLDLCKDYYEKGAKVFIISNDEGVAALDKFLSGVPW